MKSIFIKLLLIFLMGVFLFYLFYSPSMQFDVLENPAKERVAQDKNIKQSNQNNIKRPKLNKGLGVYIGKDIDTFTKRFGYPKRIYDSNFNYKNFIYEFNEQYYIVGVKDKTIVMLYATGKDANTYPFKVGESADDIFNGNAIVSEPIIKTKQGEFQFQLTEVDIKTQTLIQYDNVFVQVYIDRISNKVMALRYINPESLVVMQPYAMSRKGKTIEKTANEATHTKDEVAINSNKVLTMFEVTNYMRKINGREPLETNELINHVAQFQVATLNKDKKEKVKQVQDEIGNELNKMDIEYLHLSQNIAYNFDDVPSLINSWLNSDKHRENMLNRDINEMGGGISGSYYSLIFIEHDNKE
ncbi:CAP-associated domain-containing protein [Macrococcus capreoli]|uniref:CAP-associated domain-containing protein n=1 Tax=Macrococcus capreoli TaxID=2982690 RepID=UPI0021D5D05D|nr:CAP-associated domain-containing protein [Macrococcus sp. TMW 2.2395]MCU7558059.1 CAP-associated domain-containing protein [Macrococcus sp. TMW 2.2395]